MKPVETARYSPGAEQDSASDHAGQLKAWRGLLWAEWFAHSRLLLVFLAVWLVAVWTLPLFTHAGWILLLGPLYALMAGPVYGGGDVLEGSEEFTFALPPTRGERYLSRLIMGLGSLLILCAMNAVALGLDLPQIMAGLYVKAGIVKHVFALKPGLLYAFVFVLPVTVFALAFTISALTHSRLVIVVSWFWAALAALGLLQLCFWYENLVWESLNGFFACPILLVVSCAVLAYGFFGFRQKEVGRFSAPLALPGYWWLWSILLALGLGLAIALISSLARNFPELVRAG
jgi:hypothetical protein